MASLFRLHMCMLTSRKSSAKHGSESYADIAASLAGCGVGPAEACALGSGGSKLTESHGSVYSYPPASLPCCISLSSTDQSCAICSILW